MLVTLEGLIVAARISEKNCKAPRLVADGTCVGGGKEVVAHGGLHEIERSLTLLVKAADVVALVRGPAGENVEGGEGRHVVGWYVVVMALI
jgi:hypothetical protein